MASLGGSGIGGLLTPLLSHRTMDPDNLLLTLGGKKMLDRLTPKTRSHELANLSSLYISSFINSQELFQNSGSLTCRKFGNSSPFR
jgi:hypothetical protein